MKFSISRIVLGLMLSFGIIVACKSENKLKDHELNEIEKSHIQNLSAEEILTNEEMDVEEPKKSKETSVVVIPCSNGYEYAQQGFEIESSLENALSKSKNIKLEKFPLYKFKGSGYQGVFDKKYCDRILQFVDADFIVMSQINGGSSPIPREKPTWGYALKFLNRKTREQKSSISAKDLKTFEEVQEHIELNIDELIKKLKTN